MASITSILISLCPESNWATDGDKIIWEDKINKQPTDEEIEIERQRLTKLIPIKKLRKERNRLLQQTDVYGLADYPFPDEANKTAWLEYRKALRDLPQNVVIDIKGNLVDVVFPIKPSSRK